MPHPNLVQALAQKCVLTDFDPDLFAMHSAEGLRLTVSRRSIAA